MYGTVSAAQPGLKTFNYVVQDKALQYSVLYNAKMRIRIRLFTLDPDPDA
jgi:hypothetical protein